MNRSHLCRVTVATAVLLVTRPAAAAQPAAGTIAAWDRFVARTEARIEQGQFAGGCGARVDIESGTITHWCGTVFIPGVTLDTLLDGLLHSATVPPQEDVAASRVLGATGDSLRMYVRLIRKTIVTVTYDTEHEMKFRRPRPTVATSRSVATSIRQVGGGDHGFLWRLNSYWRYRQAPGGVAVELESLTLSRNVPAVIRPLAGPIISRVARESVARTLEALRRQYARG